jgi:hypothetical protein
LSLREQILASQADRKPVALDVPEWGVTVWLKQLTVADQIALSEGSKPEAVPVQVLIACLVDDEGKAIFTEADTEALSNEAAGVVVRVFGEAARLNGLTSAELDKAIANLGEAPPEQPDTV